MFRLKTGSASLFVRRKDHPARIGIKIHTGNYNLALRFYLICLLFICLFVYYDYDNLIEEMARSTQSQGPGGQLRVCSQQNQKNFRRHSRGSLDEPIKKLRD